jgi:tetratricopeptide (TPR) repeat protein
MDTKYKVKLNNGRLLGPLDFDRVKALARKGHFSGSESTATAPFTNWREFRMFPELAELLVKKIETEIKVKHSDTKEIAPPEPAYEATATLVQQPGAPFERHDHTEPEETSLEMPTLLDIKVPSRSIAPGEERTIVGALYPVAEATKSIDASELQVIVKKEKAVRLQPPAIPVIKTEPIPKAKTKQILSPRVALFLAAGIVLIGFLSQYKDEGAPYEFDLKPKTAPFPFFSVSVPFQVGKQPNPRGSLDLIDAGIPVFERSTPRAIMTAAKDYFFPAVQKNAKSVLARSLLATAYLRLIEVLPRDEFYFESIKKLLNPAPIPADYIPEYVVARTEFLFMLQRYEQALEFVDEYLKKTQTPELLYQKARIHFERNEIDLALNTINRALKSRNEQSANPRHRLLLAKLLELKKADPSQEVKALIKEHPKFGPGLLLDAKLSLQANKHTAALQTLSAILTDPLMLNRLELAQAFLLTARALEGLKRASAALVFADSARELMPDKEEAETLLYRLKSKLEKGTKTYSFILNGRSYEREKVYENAENQYIRARESATSNAVPLLLWGRLTEKRGDPVQAIERFRKALQLNPQSTEANLKLAELYIKRYDFAAATTHLDNAATLKRSADQVDYWRGYQYRKLGKLALGESHYRKALSSGSRHAELFVAMADIEAARNNRALAEFYFSMALRYDPLNPSALLGVALSRFYLESPSQSIAFLRGKLSTQPNSAAIMTNLGVIYLLSGDKESAKDFLQNARRSDPTYAEVYRKIGDLARVEAESNSEDFALKEKNYRYALAAYAGYSILSPNDPEGYLSSAELYFSVRDYGAAAKNYYKVLDLAPNYPGINLRLARISINGNDTKKALELILKEIKNYPDSADALIELGKIYIQQAKGFKLANDLAQATQKYEAATGVFTKAAALAEGNADAIFFLGYVHLERGNYDNAQILLERANKIEPLSPDVHIQLGRVYMKKKYKAKAIAAFTDARGLTQDPDTLLEIDNAMREESEKLNRKRK